MPSFKGGDIVSLKSGSAPMVVFEVDRDIGNQKVMVGWFHEGDGRSCVYPSCALVYASGDGIAQDATGAPGGILQV